MIIIIQQSDLQDKSFPVDKLSEAFKISKLFFTQIKPDADEFDSFIIAKSLYAEQGTLCNKSVLIDYIGKAL